MEAFTINNITSSDLLYLCIGALVFSLSFFLVWYFRKYIPLYRERTKPIVTLYEPPRGLSPSQVGLVYLKESDLSRLVTAEMTSLSELGYITIQRNRRDEYAAYLVGWVFLAIFLLCFLGVFIYVSFIIGTSVLALNNVAFHFLYILLIIFFARNFYKKIKGYIQNFLANQSVLDFTFTESQNGKVIPDHLVDLLDFLKMMKVNHNVKYLFYKRILRDFFNRIFVSLPEDHLKERSILGKKHYTSRKKKSLLFKISIFLIISFFIWPLYLFLTVFLFEIGVFKFIATHPHEMLYIITTLIVIRILFLYKNYLVNQIFYKTNLWYEVMGFRHYIEIAEEDRIKFFNNPHKSLEVYSKYLPYAIIFGLEKKWKNLFKPLLGIGE